MDFSQAAYFGGTQPYQFANVPTLTPSQCNSAASDEFNTTSPPVEPYSHHFSNNLPQDHFPGFDGYSQYHHQPQTFPGSPTPPTLRGGFRHLPQQHPAVNGFDARAGSDAPHLSKVELSDDPSQTQRQGSNSEEDDLTPAQSRRKAQNRAAQRAFRERKERHVKDLEAKLASLEAAQQETASENEHLRQNLQKISIENEILRATSSARSSGSSRRSDEELLTTGPMRYNPSDFYTSVLQGHSNKTPSHRIVTSNDGERLLAAGAMWDLIVNHELFKRGLVDVADVSNRVKSKAKCDGQGPVFEERVILEAIEQSAANNDDGLL